MYALVPVCIYKVRFVLFQASNYGNLCQRTSPEFCAVLPGMKVLLWAVARAMSSIHWSLPRGGVLQPSYSCIQSMHAVGYAWMVWNTYWQRFLTYWGNSSNMLGVSSSCCKHDLLHWLVEHSHRELVRIRSQSPQVCMHTPSGTRNMCVVWRFSKTSYLSHENRWHMTSLAPTIYCSRWQ